MVIKTTKELKAVLKEEKYNYFSRNLRFFEEIKLAFEKNRIYRIWKLQKNMRICEHLKTKQGLFYRLRLRFVRRKFNSLCELLNIEIYPGNFGKGLLIFHSGIVVNSKATIGDNCILHGNNCIGNIGVKSSAVPVLGDSVDIGFGAVVVGGVELADGVVIGSNAVVNKSFLEPNSKIVGVPAKLIK